MKREPDHELEALLSLDGQEFKFAGGHVVKYKVRRVSPDRGRPQGISYSLTLHDPRGKRIYGIDNAHTVRRQHEFDHSHRYSSNRTAAYEYRGPVGLLEDFLAEVERILIERGAL
jgi:hypothetical protein